MYCSSQALQLCTCFYLIFSGHLIQGFFPFWCPVSIVGLHAPCICFCIAVIHCWQINWLIDWWAKSSLSQQFLLSWFLTCFGICYSITLHFMFGLHRYAFPIRGGGSALHCFFVLRAPRTLVTPARRRGRGGWVGGEVARRRLLTPSLSTLRCSPTVSLIRPLFAAADVA